MTEPMSLFVEDGGALIATELSRGPWDPTACHGGPVAALLTRSCEHLDGDDGAAWQLARITVELVRPVPVLTPMFLTAQLERPGRNVSLIGTGLTMEDGTEVAKARGLRIRAADVHVGEEYRLESPFSEPGVGSQADFLFDTDETAFHRDAVDMRFAEGAWLERGPIALWCKVLFPVLPGEAMSGPQRAVATADFSNGVSNELDSDRMLFINPDLSVHLLRPPEGEWIGMQARSHYGPSGAGLAEASLYDARGRCGRSAQSLFLAVR